MFKHQGLALIVVLVFLIISSSLAIVSIFSLQSQHGLTRSYVGLDEIRYAKEAALRRGIWVWRYKYGDLNYFQSRAECETQPCYLNVMTELRSQNVEQVTLIVEDKNNNRKLDNGEIEISVVEKSWH